MDGRNHLNTCIFLKQFFLQMIQYTVQAGASLYRTYLSKVFDPISKMSFYVFVSKDDAARDELWW